ncbi:hypothetical protein FFK22_001540 [Mycobacterium sp. KBS0706]|uniref:hypothetical protein n=1 Tax=Mycobacterium sp. KBS0706 TaxID=2578109 RepID=UPI00110F8AA3|nr:hypothetical protein [Mycobacterium sp. KBS0706]TSD90527.1 hypothetical protein FFK22_001540 [Mycobacterium sp. KBS0706]
MTRVTITGLFDNPADAADARRDIEAFGISRNDIGLLAHDSEHVVRDDDDGSDAASGAGTGAGIGTVLGGGAGLLTGLGVMAIPGVGPIVAAGWLAATLAGAAAGAVAGGATGGLIGAMTDSGVDEDSAHVYAEGVRRGGTLLTVQVEQDQAAQVQEILLENGAIDAAARGEAYRSSGWTRYDPRAPVYTPDEIARERDLYGRGDTRV